MLSSPGQTQEWAAAQELLSQGRKQEWAAVQVLSSQGQTQEWSSQGCLETDDPPLCKWHSKFVSFSDGRCSTSYGFVSLWGLLHPGVSYMQWYLLDRLWHHLMLVGCKKILFLFEPRRKLLLPEDFFIAYPLDGCRFVAILPPWKKDGDCSGSGAWFIKSTLYASWLGRLCKPSSLVCGTGNCEEMEEPVEPAIGDFLVVICWIWAFVFLATLLIPAKECAMMPPANYP